MQIVKSALEEWQPVQIVLLFSGGYDSMVMCDALKNEEFDVPVSTYAIDTNLSADGWTDYVRDVANELQFPDFDIYNNDHGFAEFVKWVTAHGCPRTRQAHTRCYARLKERAIMAILKKYKMQRSDKVLFLSGLRKYESAHRSKLTEPVQRLGKSCAIFANPLFYWTDEDIAKYRITHDLPDNPFYSTVKGSGDCQCNWGNFITIGTLKKYSPSLASGNVGILDEISKKHHGYGWDGTNVAQLELFDTENLDTPFLCTSCSRSNKIESIEQTMLQRGIF